MPNFGPDFITATTMTADLIRATRGYAQGGSKQNQNILNADFNSGDDLMTMKYPIPGIGPGMTLEIGWVEYAVVEVSTATKQVTVIPEIEGVESDHDEGARVTFRPRYSARRVIEAINSELSSLSAAGLYKPVTVEAVEGVVTLPNGALAVLDAWGEYIHHPDDEDPRPKQLPAGAFDIADSADGPILVGPHILTKATVGCVLTPLSLTTDQVVSTTTGLSELALDLPPLGAAMRLLAGTESQRNIIDSQGETRRAQEVPTGGPTTSLRNLAAVRQQRLVEEVQRFQQRYGFVRYPGVY